MQKKQADFSLTNLLPRSLILWMVCNLAACLAVSFYLNMTAKRDVFIGYGISAVSFISSLITAKLILSSCKKGVLVNALIISAAFIIFSLLIGFLIDSSSIDVSGILSLTTFTLAGTFSGAVLMPAKRTKTPRIKPAT